MNLKAKIRGEHFAVQHWVAELADSCPEPWDYSLHLPLVSKPLPFSAV